ncbi:MAG: HDOD domain-containing protein [Gammaproteobacteria bacterium]|nr:HDOD domain-containing protein [Gammaproteobacteria bacterium]
MLPQRNQESVMPGRLRPFAPFAQLSAEQLIVAAGRTALKRFRDGDLVLTRGSEDDSDYFLLDGNVVLLDSDGNSKMIASGSSDAANPLAPLRPALFDVRALGPVLCAKMARGEVALLREASLRVPRARPEDAEAALDETSDLFRDLEGDILADRLKLPSLPDHALRVRSAISQAAADSRKVADLLAADPALAAKILKVANSPLCRGDSTISNLRDAVNRIGMFTVGELVVCFSLKDLFNANSPRLRERFGELVIEAVRIGATASVIATRVNGVAADQALVAGLLSNIGAYVVLERLSQQPQLLKDATRVERTLAAYTARLSKVICRHWQLGDGVVEAVGHVTDWSYEVEGVARLAEVVICARYHSLISLRKARQLPRPETIKAMRILGTAVTPELSMDIIREARARIDALQQALT